MRSNNNSELISIVVPIYNSETYLRRCIDSILNQSYENLEVVLVDDGSTDNSGEICESYKSNDSRLKVFHIKNSGVAQARNYALEHITGDYVMFVDSDDWIEPSMCSEMLSEALDNKADMLVTNAINWDAEGTKCDSSIVLPTMKQIDLNLEFSFLENYALGVVWGTLYKRECIENIKFEMDLSVGEDTLFFAMAVKNSTRFFYSRKKYYNYVIYDTSAAHGKLTDERMTNLIAWKRVIDLFENNARICNTAKGAYGRQCAYFIKEIDKTSPYYQTLKHGIRQNIRYMLLAPTLKSKFDYIGYYVFTDNWNKMKNALKKSK